MANNDIVAATAVTDRDGNRTAVVRVERTDDDRYRVRTSTFGPYRERIDGPYRTRTIACAAGAGRVAGYTVAAGYTRRPATGTDMVARAA